MIRERTMRRAAILTTLTIAAMTPSFAADQIATPHVKREARGALPPGLPRMHYKARTTVVYQPAPRPVAVVAGLVGLARLLRPALRLRLPGPVLWRRPLSRLFLAPALRLRRLRLMLKRFRAKWTSVRVKKTGQTIF